MVNIRENKIVILGGGYAGVVAALNLSRKIGDVPAQITLVNAADHFVERIRLHQQAAHEPLRRYRYSELLRNTGVSFVQGWVTKLSTGEQMVTLRTNTGTIQLDFDYLIYALGSTVDINSVPGCAEYTMSLSSETTTLALQRQLPYVAQQRGRLLVCGGGLTGIEAAAEFAEAYPGLHVTLVMSGVFGERLSAAGQRHLRRVFDRLGIEVIENQTVTRVHAQHVDCGEETKIPFEICLWAGAFAVPSLASQAGLPVNALGQAIVDTYLRVEGHPNIYAVGDAASLEEAMNFHIRMACATAVPMGIYAGRHLAGMLREQTQPDPFRFSYVLRCISLGRRDALIQFVAADDTPKEHVLTGRLAVWTKEMVCRSPIWIIRFLQRLASWSGSTRVSHLVRQDGAQRQYQVSNP